MKQYLAAAAVALAVASSSAQAGFNLDTADVFHGPSGGRREVAFGFSRMLLEYNNDLVGCDPVTPVPGAVDPFEALELKERKIPVGVLLRGPGDTLFNFDRLVGNRVLRILGFDVGLSWATEPQFIVPPLGFRRLTAAPGFDDSPSIAAGATFQPSAPPDIPTVPEPASIAGLTCLAAAAAARRPRRPRMAAA